MTYSAPQPVTAQEDAWWVQQWVDLLNSYRFKKRLERGRNYARQGNILSLEFRDSKVHATVQGTANEPYQLSIWIERFTDEDWGFVIDTLSQKALYSAQLLAGEMPDSIEAVFTSNGLSLFPFTLADVKSKCSCPDPKNPCKHIAAVYYQLGDAFREDPFVLFQLRGRTKEQILEALRQHRQQTAGEATGSEAELADEPKEILPSEPAAKAKTTLPIETFWTYDTPIDPSLVVITPAEQTVLEVIGDMPLPTSEAQIVMAHFKTLYQNVAQQAMITALS
ncbi:SWIM zinc finger domain protein [Synechococcus sp. PCC 7335]|uniref:SWIM zinc finger family protein n=1 Tax=Synechococcus sp. (strain ATCC 29403 / PCC 7335) TaxID=91464 RepID=UPI00017EB514|nr:SWIM zinc finger family protein [Synechococcus sp. PCC 7335]EDX83777.1 SWIM zinc finger domain protein [Synechococcus sp. PCC 7335]